MARIWVADTDPNERFTLYTRGNVGEVFPHTMTALTGTLIGQAVHDGQTEVLVEMGVLRPHEITGPSVGTGVFGGYLYMSGSAMRLFGVRMPGMTPRDADEQMMGEVTDVPPYRPAKGDRNLIATVMLSRYVLRLMRSPDLRPLEQARTDAAGVAGDDARPGFGTGRAPAAVAPHVPPAASGEHEAAPRVQRPGRRPAGPPGPLPRPPRSATGTGQPHRRRDWRRRLRPAGPQAVGVGPSRRRRSIPLRRLRRRPRWDRRAHARHAPPAGARRVPRRAWPPRQRRVRTRHTGVGDGPDAGLRRRRPPASRAGRTRSRRHRGSPCGRRRRRPGRRHRPGASAAAMGDASLRARCPPRFDRPGTGQGHPRPGEPRRSARARRTGPPGRGAGRPGRRAPGLLCHGTGAGRLRRSSGGVRRSDRRAGCPIPLPRRTHPTAMVRRSDPRPGDLGRAQRVPPAPACRGHDRQRHRRQRRTRLGAGEGDPRPGRPTRARPRRRPRVSDHRPLLDAAVPRRGGRRVRHRRRAEPRGDRVRASWASPPCSASRGSPPWPTARCCTSTAPMAPSSSAHEAPDAATRAGHHSDPAGARSAATSSSQATQRARWPDSGCFGHDRQ